MLTWQDSHDATTPRGWAAIAIEDHPQYEIGMSSLSQSYLAENLTCGWYLVDSHGRIDAAAYVSKPFGASAVYKFGHDYRAGFASITDAKAWVEATVDGIIAGATAQAA